MAAWGWGWGQGNLTTGAEEPPGGGKALASLAGGHACMFYTRGQKLGGSREPCMLYCVCYTPIARRAGRKPVQLSYDALQLAFGFLKPVLFPSTMLP